jgi:hypothetical protein
MNNFGFTAVKPFLEVFYLPESNVSYLYYLNADNLKKVSSWNCKSPPFPQGFYMRSKNSIPS